mgnify:CR=1 FL=1
MLSRQMKRKLTRRGFLRTAVLGTAATGALFHIGKSHAQAQGRVIMLGYDGMEPSIVEEMLERGELPNLGKLRETGAYRRLGSTIPPQSPVAWNTYATCKNPGGHNIFDFIRRDPKSPGGPMPLVGTGKLVPPVIGTDGGLQEPAKGINYRTGIPFWSVADEQGKRGKILNIPFAFPPDPLKNGMMISALGVPDLRGTTSTYFSLSDSFTQEELSEDLGGGRRIALAFDGSDEALFPVPGPRDNRYRFSDPNAYTSTPLRFKINRGDKRGKISDGDSEVDIEQGAWSEWLELRFEMSPKVEVHGITRFFPMEIGERVRIYMACVQYHPDAPYSALTSPEPYSAELKGRFGLYKTIGWAYDTHALRQNDLEEEAFLKDIDDTMSFRDRLTLDELKRGEFDFLLSAWTATDRAGHMFWRYRDEGHPYYTPEAPEHWKKALEYTYKRADAQTGAVLEQLREEDTLFVFSDHGFGSWRQGFNLNTWLRDNGYLSVKDPKQADRGFLMGIDWNETKAYSVGLSSLYLNIKGRETGGVVEPDAAEALIAELKDKLAGVKDPKTGANVFSSLYPRGVYSGEAMGDAPDISLGYAPYYQNSRQTSRGGVGAPLLEPVMDKWSGEHAASDCKNCPGVFFSNKPLDKEDPRIQDLGMTTLSLLGVDAPSDYEGDVIL